MDKGSGQQEDSRRDLGPPAPPGEGLASQQGPAQRRPGCSRHMALPGARSWSPPLTPAQRPLAGGLAWGVRRACQGQTVPSQRGCRGRSQPGPQGLLGPEAQAFAPDTLPLSPGAASAGTLGPPDSARGGHAARVLFGHTLREKCRGSRSCRRWGHVTAVPWRGWCAQLPPWGHGDTGTRGLLGSADACSPTLHFLC